MINLELKPYPGEGEDSFAKRRAYYIRILKRRMNVGLTYIPKKQANRMLINTQEKEMIDSFWERYLPEKIRKVLVNYSYYEIYKNVIAHGEQLYHYIPDSFYQTFIDEYYTNPQHSDPCDDKNLYDLYFHDINRPRTIFRMTDGLCLDAEYHEISLRTALAKCREENEVILKKGIFCYGGEGIMFWSKNRQDEHELFAFISESKNVVCQRVIKQHPVLSRLNPTSVNTIRFLSFLFKGKVHVLSSVIRMGKKGSKVDNASSGGIVCGIEYNGQLKSIAFDTSGHKYFKHPSGKDFASTKIPNYTDCIELVRNLARRFSSISRLISWDFAIDENAKPLLIEFNLSFGEIDFHQYCNGPVFGDLTEDVLNDVFTNSYTLNSILRSFEA